MKEHLINPAEGRHKTFMSVCGLFIRLIVSALCGIFLLYMII